MDIGAHYGFFSFFAAMYSANESVIHAFEPSKNNFIKLLKNKDANSKFSNIQPFHQAVSSLSGKRELSLGRPQNKSLFKNYISGFSETETVICTTLDDFMSSNKTEKIDFLKIDCEGGEHEIFHYTSIETLQKIQVISMELHDMRHCGYDYIDTLKVLESSGLEVLSSNLNDVIHQPEFNAKIVLVRQEK